MRLVAAVLLGVLLGGCGGSGPGDGPAALVELLAVTPASAVDRALFFSTGDEGFGSVLGVDAFAAAFGFPADAVTAVVESGEPPVTVLGGGFDVEAVAATFTGLGYARAEQDGWVVVRAASMPADAPAVAQAVPAAALRADVLVLGTVEDVTAAVAGEVAGDLDWIDRLVPTLDPATAAAVVGAPPDVTRRAQEAGTTPAELLAQAGVTEPLAPYQGFAIGGPLPEATGVIALAYPPGEGDAEVASALALRLATSTMLGDRARRTTDVLEPGAPRYQEAASVVVLPVEWTDFDADRLRADVEQAALGWLVPSQTAD